MPLAYPEGQFVEQPALGLFAELGWAVVSALEESLGNAGAFHTWFGATLDAIKTLDWAAIRATDCCHPSRASSSAITRWPLCAAVFRRNSPDWFSPSFPAIIRTDPARPVSG